MSSVVISMCGAPASGKSTLSTRLLKRAEEAFASLADCELIHFDNYEEDREAWGKGSFQSGRNHALAQLLSMLSGVRDAEGLACHKQEPSNDHCDHPKAVLAIVDDIMYLRSMRREVYVIAREHRCHHLVVYVDTDLDVCRERNSSRNEVTKINEQSLQRIHSQLEPPRCSDIADRHSVRVPNNGDELRCVSIVMYRYAFSMMNIHLIFTSHSSCIQLNLISVFTFKTVCNPGSLTYSQRSSI
jgi:tRNA uridine 5-carbamoylmethylation protein Kti12